MPTCTSVGNGDSLITEIFSKGTKGNRNSIIQLILMARLSVLWYFSTKVNFITNINIHIPTVSVLEKIKHNSD